jgi:hypothetical protein
MGHGVYFVFFPVGKNADPSTGGGNLCKNASGHKVNIFFGQTKRIEYPERTNPDLLELLKGMLDIEFKKRWKIEKIITHSWVTNNGELDL